MLRGYIEAATVKTIEDGIMSGDLAKLAEPAAAKIVYTEEFIDEVARRLEGE
jgi:isocitrate dehydrogenase